MICLECDLVNLIFYNEKSHFSLVLLSVYDKKGLVELAKAFDQQHVRLVASGGTAKMLREYGLEVT